MYEYKVVSAPSTGLKKKGLKRVEDRFAAQIEDTINALAAERWEYLRADTLPCEERSGLTSKSTRFHALLVFRRPVEDARADLDRPRADPEQAAGGMRGAEPERAPEVLSVLRDMKGPTRRPGTEEDALDAASDRGAGDARP